MRRALYPVLALSLLPLPALADDRSYLTALLEDNLSGAGRKVVITGFAGALSSRASLTELTIADDAGIWLTLKDVSLDWNRSALLSGEVSVNELTADEIILTRLPQADTSLPAPEAGEFALPELPVSVDIGRIAAERIEIGPTVLGTPIEGVLEASMSLNGGEGKASVNLERTDDGPEGRVALEASFSNTSKSLSLDLTAEEGAGGIAVTLLDLPGLPSASLTIQGTGPFSDYAADVKLATDGVDRLSGSVKVLADDKGGTGFAADLSGDLAPLFLPDYAEFFGNRIALIAKGSRAADGRMDLSQFDLTAQAIDLSGSLALSADGMPRAFDLTGRIARQDGAPVLLPLTTDLPVKVTAADIALSYDLAKGEGWSGRAAITGFDRADFRASQLELSGSGRIARKPDGATFGATLRFAAEGLDPTDPNLARALGSVVAGDALLYWTSGAGSIAVPKLVLSGENYSARLTAGRIAGLDDALQVSGQVEAEMEDLSRLSGLAGMSLGGNATFKLTGSGSPLTGAFDLDALATGTDLKSGIAELDGLLAGPSTVGISARRDTSGTVLRNLTIDATTLTATAQGTIASTGSDLTATLNFSDLRVLGKGYGGGLTGDAKLTGTLEDGRVTLEARGTSLKVGQVEADKLLAGESRVSLALALKDGAVQVERAVVTNPQLEATATGVLTEGTQSIDLDAQLKSLALFLPEFPGSLSVTGKIVQDASGTTVDVAGRGPGGIDATVKGTLAPGFGSAALAIKGGAQAALGNIFISPRSISGDVAFDLRLNGPLALSSLSGSASLAGGRLADPSLPFALQNIDAQANISGGRAAINATVPVSSGGQAVVTGSVATASPYNGDLEVALQRLTVRDPQLYDVTMNGNLNVTGPLLGGALIAGRIALTEAELRVPSTGFGGAGGLPDLKHKGEPADVRATRARAGLLDDGVSTGGAGGGPSYLLDITLSAPNQVFVRGRGLDAELGGELRLLGSTSAVSPSGAFDLIRGRLEILGKRLDLTEAQLLLEGDLIPSIRVVATTENDGITSGVEITGPATDPVVRFTSSPDLPEEEVLAQLLFGQGLQNLTAFQALQLANAVATLAGRGGEGIVGKLRKGFGLDNLDVKTGADGGAEVTAGKYLGKNIYSEVTVDQTGKTDINLNLDVTKSVTVRGRASSDGTTGIGVYLEKDY